MSKIKRILTALFMLILAVGGYLFYRIDIYSSPYVAFSTPDTHSFQPVNPYCSQSTIAPSPLQQDKFRLLVWNIHKGQDEGWQSELTRFSQQADFLLLQEVTNQQNLAVQFSHQFPTALYVAAFADAGRQSGVQILSKAVPDLVCADMESEPWIIIPKVASAARFPLKNQQSLLIVNLHLVNFELTPTNYRRQIEKMMGLIAKHQGPIILAGDFNTWNEGRLKLVRRLAQQVDLQELSYLPDNRMRFLGNPLDHIFIRGFNVIQATTEQTDSSDHNPLLAELELRR